MARPKLPLPDSAAIMKLADAQGMLEVRVSTNVSGEAVILPGLESSKALTVRTTATPENGKANQAVLRLLAKALDLPVSDLELVRGATSRNKLVRIGPRQG